MARKINPDNLPWFPFHALKWKYSATVMGMTKAERGIYHDLLVENWLAGDIPLDVTGVAKLLNIHRTVAERFLKKFSTLAVCVQHSCSTSAACLLKGCRRYYFPSLLELTTYDTTLHNTTRQDRTGDNTTLTKEEKSPVPSSTPSTGKTNPSKPKSSPVPSECPTGTAANGWYCKCPGKPHQGKPPAASLPTTESEEFDELA